ncbi:EF-P 5-aminopentanol modification-associated protein YfmF [Caproicibacterium sp. BJN0003]|uniref:EF-P 5-aminopentanol modification-associated protein YfmF n=1 Tax=Caproicibacterium sp. BJN0003 TaxID=2994078 RepID=UPI00225826E6|nr:pitrilysin family protein [Caproicibacterium sp. BJN0003]UZT83216.1 pitrilysin family protein [Caproicibacterium sp. BJN0003]
MPELEQTALGNGIRFLGVRDPKFKTFRISVNFFLPMKKNRAAATAMIPFLLSRASREYPDFSAMSKKMADLYGSVVTAEASKLGDAQVLTLSAAGISDRYALSQEKISYELANVLCGMIFDPLIENGLFPKDGFEQEKRQSLERMDAEYNDKRMYALLQCQKLMFSDEPAGIDRFGGRSAVEALRPEELVPAWKELLRNSKIELLSLGDCDSQAVCSGFQKAFSGIHREPETCDTIVKAPSEKILEKTEKQNVAQGKLVMGFRSAINLQSPKWPAMALMNTVFGGSPSSKLFLNVRERLSLCYYCSSLFDSMKGAMFVQSGVETKNFEAAQAEIQHQMDEMKKGNITEEEISSAKLTMENSYRTVMDSLWSLENWYVGQTYAPKIKTPLEYADQISKVKSEEIVEAAQKIQPAAVYRLTSSEGAKS